MKTRHWYVQRKTNRLFQSRPPNAILLRRGTWLRGIVTVTSRMSPEKFAELKERMAEMYAKQPPCMEVL